MEQILRKLSEIETTADEILKDAAEHCGGCRVIKID